MAEEAEGAARAAPGDVTVRFTRRHEKWLAGWEAGFPRLKADELVARGVAVEVATTATAVLAQRQPGRGRHVTK